jgi:hypothetical protein
MGHHEMQCGPWYPVLFRGGIYSGSQFHPKCPWWNPHTFSELAVSVRESTILLVPASVLWNSLKKYLHPLPVKWHRRGKPRISTLIPKETMGFWHLFGEHIYPKVTNFQFPSPGWSCRSGVIDTPINFTKVLHQSRHVLTDGYTNKLVAGTY